MSNSGFTLLWSKILDSSIWMEDATTRLVWITMLAMKDKDGIVKAAVIGLAHRARVTLEECQKALKVFESPDVHSSNQQYEGRRIQVVPGGWVILNHEEYRYSTEAKRDFWKAQKAEQREKAKINNNGKKSKAQLRREKKASTDYIARERRSVKAYENGDERLAGEIAAEGLPGEPEM